MNSLNTSSPTLFNTEKNILTENVNEKNVHPVSFIQDEENRQSILAYGTSPLAKKAKDSLLLSTALKKRKKKNKYYTNRKIIEDDEESVEKIYPYLNNQGNEVNEERQLSNNNIHEVSQYHNNIPFIIQSHDAFNNRSLGKLNESFTLKKTITSNNTENNPDNNNKIESKQNLKTSNRNFSLCKGNLIEEINDISVINDQSEYEDKKVSLSKFSTGIININCGYVKSGSTPFKEELINQTLAEIRRPRVSRYLYSKVDTMKVDNQYCITIGNKEDIKNKLNQLINIYSNVNNLTLTPIKNKQASSFEELSIIKKNEITINKTSKSDKERSAYKEKIMILEKELEMKNNEKMEFQTAYSQIKNELENAETYRMELHKYIEEVKGNIRVFIRVKSNDSSNSTANIEKFNKSDVKNLSSNLNQVKDKDKDKDTALSLLDSKQKSRKEIILYSTVTNENSHDANNMIKSKSCNNLNKNNKKFIDSLNLINPASNQSSNFHFNYIFKEDSIQEEVFSQVQPLIISALDGENICIFAYGATGSGKTYTMQGKTVEMNNKLELNPSSGILPRAAFFLFDEFNRRSKTGQTFLMEFAALEIYNENIYDLMDANEKKNTINNGFVKGLKFEKIRSKEDIIKLVIKAGDSRTTDSTAFNSTSSRSHAVFQLKIEISQVGSNLNTTSKTSFINIIDLAGSEKCTYNPTSCGNSIKSKPSPKQIELMKKLQTEANFINKSLTSLGRIISMLADKSRQIPPYRESKLTMILQNSLSANSKTALIVTVCNSSNFYSQTRDSLNFAKNAMMNL